VQELFTQFLAYIASIDAKLQAPSVRRKPLIGNMESYWKVYSEPRAKPQDRIAPSHFVLIRCCFPSGIIRTSPKPFKT